MYPYSASLCWSTKNGLSERLPLNTCATFLWWFHVPIARQRAMLVGDAIILGWPDDEGRPTDVPEEVENLLLGTQINVVEAKTLGNPEWRHLGRAQL